MPNQKIDLNPSNDFFCTQTDIPTDVKEVNTLSDFQFKIYPNPARDFIRIESGNSLSSHSFSFSIFNIAGQLVYQFQNQQFNQEIPISFLEKGIYLLEIQTESGRSQHKFIKQ